MVLYTRWGDSIGINLIKTNLPTLPVSSLGATETTGLCAE